MIKLGFFFYCRYLCHEDWSHIGSQYESIYTVTIMFLQYIIPFSVLLFTYTSIAIVIWCHKIPGEAENSRDERIAKSKRKFLVLNFETVWSRSSTIIIMSSTMSVVINNMEDFTTKLKDTLDRLIVVDFFAPWCGPCKIMEPLLEELAIELGESILILKVDVDECEEIAVEYNVNALPTFLLIKNSNIIQQVSGSNFDELKKIVEENK
ncbi:hypothetical protein FQA39_LY09767 [Lamprigera yunnana]|nr:hypothetical protein FQA39_LY09767 [Lamprigera yunnana]